MTVAGKFDLRAWYVALLVLWLVIGLPFVWIIGLGFAGFLPFLFFLALNTALFLPILLAPYGIKRIKSPQL